MANFGQGISGIIILAMSIDNMKLQGHQFCKAQNLYKGKIIK
jgi:hypothetical protein